MFSSRCLGWGICCKDSVNIPEAFFCGGVCLFWFCNDYTKIACEKKTAEAVF